MTIMRTIDHVTGTGSTISTGTVDLVTYSLIPNSSTGGLFLTAQGKSAAATPLICTRHQLASYKKTSGGTLTIHGLSTPESFTDLALLATDCTMLASGGNVVVRATGGLLGTNMEWGCDLFVSIT